MTTKRTWTEDEYEAAGKKSIHLRLEKKTYDMLAWLANRLGVGRAELIEELIVEREHKEYKRSK
jgi:macrodomain Ter protein organizer (MatP/YcbG family)